MENTDIDEDFKKDIKAFIEACGMKALAESSITQSIENAKLVNYTLPPAYWDIFLQELDMDEYMDMLVPFFGKHFTREEIQGLTEFFDSLVGKTFLSDSVRIGEEASLVLKEWGDELSARALEKLKETEPEIFAELESQGEEPQGEGDCQCPMCGCLVWMSDTSCKHCGAEFEEG